MPGAKRFSGGNPRVIQAGLVCLAIAGCTTVDSYVNADARPGGIVMGKSQFDRLATDLDPFRGSGPGSNTQWTRIRVIAPAGANCRIIGQSIFIPKGPEPNGRASESGEVMLTYNQSAKSAEFECRTDSGRLQRTVEAVPLDITYQDRTVSTIHVKPPLVHMQPADPAAKARWDALEMELCGAETTSYVTACEPGMWDKLRASDIGG